MTNVQVFLSPLNKILLVLIFFCSTGFSSTAKIPFEISPGNEKEVFPSQLDSLDQWITFTIVFQNTTGSSVNTVTIVDSLDENLDWSTFQILSFSHDHVFQISPTGVASFVFNNISLPDSSANAVGSSGWIQFRMKPLDSLSIGTTIINKATVLFDSGPAVLTNQVSVTYCDLILSEQEVVICQGQTFQVGNSVYTSAGTYADYFVSNGGCDSIVLTHLNVHQPITFDQTFALCPGDSVLVGSHWYSVPGVYTDVFAGPFGCDSIVHTTIEIEPTDTISYHLTICHGDSVVVGSNVYHNSGTYYDQFGCDSVVVTFLSVSLSSAPIVVDGSNLSSLPGFNSYQWIDCVHDTVVANQSLTFNAAYTSNYAVIVTDNEGCTALSDCILVIVVSSGNDPERQIVFFPNPTKNILFIKADFQSVVSIHITDVAARNVFHGTFKGSTQYDLSDLPSGMYQITLSVGEQLYSSMLVIQR